jgi:gamma-glutamyl-gamma-aminobutyrate hydrolase PuuD
VSRVEPDQAATDLLALAVKAGGGEAVPLLTGEPFVLGIQFHPERPGEVPEMVGVFDALVTKGRIA